MDWLNVSENSLCLCSSFTGIKIIMHHILYKDTWNIERVMNSSFFRLFHVYILEIISDIIPQGSDNDEKKEGKHLQTAPLWFDPKEILTWNVYISGFLCTSYIIQRNEFLVNHFKQEWKLYQPELRFASLIQLVLHLDETTKNVHIFNNVHFLVGLVFKITVSL